MKTDGKILRFGENVIETEYTIRKIIDYDNQLVALIYDNVIEPNNVICFDNQGRELWKINDILKIKSPSGIVDIIKESDNVPAVISVVGFRYKVDIKNRVLIEKVFLR